MNTKINLFTALIIVYSIVVCSVFKKEDSLQLESTKATINISNKMAKYQKNEPSREVFTASVGVSKQEMQ